MELKIYLYNKKFDYINSKKKIIFLIEFNLKKCIYIKHIK